MQHNLYSPLPLVVGYTTKDLKMKDLPLHSKEFGSYYFDFANQEFVEKLKSLKDISYHNDSMPSFLFGEFEHNNKKYCIHLFCGLDSEIPEHPYEEEWPFVFSLSLYDLENEIIIYHSAHEKVIFDDICKQLGFPNEYHYGTDFKNMDIVFKELIDFIDKFGSPTLDAEIKNVIVNRLTCFQ